MEKASSDWDDLCTAPPPPNISGEVKRWLSENSDGQTKSDWLSYTSGGFNHPVQGGGDARPKCEHCGGGRNSNDWGVSNVNYFVPISLLCTEINL